MFDTTSSGDRMEMEDRNLGQYQKALHTHFVAQWITSLAISVICCAVLFVVFAGYIVKIHESANLAEVRLEVLSDRIERMQSQLDTLTRAPLVQINSPTAPQTMDAQQTGSAKDQPQTPEGAAKAQQQPQPLPDETGISLPQSESSVTGETEGATPPQTEPQPAPKASAKPAPQPAPQAAEIPQSDASRSHPVGIIPSLPIDRKTP